MSSERNRAGVDVALRVLTLRATAADYQRFDNRLLVAALVCTWLVGIGRWWDDPRASLWQHLGLGSLAYVLVLAAVLYAIVKPFRPPNWRYRHVLTFVGLTAIPGILYAIPVEMLMPINQAITFNVWFLAVVATWRVAMLILYFRRHGALSWAQVQTTSLLPLTAIVAALTALNLERAVFNIMGGLDKQTAGDGAYLILILLTTASVVLLPLLAIGYIVQVVSAWKKRRIRP